MPSPPPLQAGSGMAAGADHTRDHALDHPGRPPIHHHTHHLPLNDQPTTSAPLRHSCATCRNGIGLGPCGQAGHLRLAAVSVCGGCARDECGGAGPGPTLVSGLCLLSLAGTAASVGRVGVLLPELSRPRDDEPTGGAGWGGISLSPLADSVGLLVTRRVVCWSLMVAGVMICGCSRPSPFSVPGCRIEW